MFQSTTKRVVSMLAASVILVTMFFSTTPVFAADDGTAEYTVKAGDNLTEIAKRFGLTVEKIMQVNPGIRDENQLLVGQVIILPSGQSEGIVPRKQGRFIRFQLEKDGGVIEPEEQFYLVKSGDTLSRIAKAYGVSLEKLIENNPQIEDPTKLYREELVRIPDGRAEIVPPFYFTPPSTTSK